MEHQQQSGTGELGKDRPCHLSPFSVTLRLVLVIAVLELLRLTVGGQVVAVLSGRDSQQLAAREGAQLWAAAATAATAEAQAQPQAARPDYFPKPTKSHHQQKQRQRQHEHEHQQLGWGRAGALRRALGRRGLLRQADESSGGGSPSKCGGGWALMSRCLMEHKVSGCIAPPLACSSEPGTVRPAWPCRPA